MICKWCGETVKSGDKTCRRCRREVSPLSDCGGFYDLVPQARNAAVPAAPMMDAPACDAPASKPGQVPVKPVLPEKKSGIPSIVTIVAAVLALVMLVSTVSLSGKLKAAQEQIQNLRKELSEAEEQNNVTDPTTPDNPDKPADPTKPGGDSETEDPVEDVTLTVQMPGDRVEVMFTEEANRALQAGKNVEVICTDGEGAMVCAMTIYAEKSEDEVYVMVEIHTDSEEVHIEWYDPENADRPMTWELVEDSTSMFAPGNVIDGEDDGETEKSDAKGKDKDEDEDEQEGPVCCKLTVKLEEEPFALSCAVTAENDAFRIVMSNIVIG